jgi:poly-gamma-glutamate synthesis protein (capsule biosynthesis protein)
MADKKILFLGDVYLDNIYKIPEMHSPFICNLEAPLTKLDTPIEAKVNLKTSGFFLKGTFEQLPIAVSLANNHIMDYGNDAFIDTINFLEENNIGYFGAGAVANNYNNPLILNMGNLKIGLLGYCYDHFYNQISEVKGLKYGPAPLDFEIIQKDIKVLRNKTDRIIIQLHWGIEQCNYPTSKQVQLARQIAGLDVNLIVGHHAHTIQPVERFRETIIAYGVGNFIFPDINVVSYFDPSNNTSRRYKYKQRAWNKCSAGLLYNLCNHQCKIMHYYFNGRSVEEENKYYHKYLTQKLPQDLNLLNKKVKKNIKCKNLLQRITRFIETPKIPSRQGVKDTLDTLLK